MRGVCRYAPSFFFPLLALLFLLHPSFSGDSLVSTEESTKTLQAGQYKENKRRIKDTGSLILKSLCCVVALCSSGCSLTYPSPFPLPRWAIFLGVCWQRTVVPSTACPPCSSDLCSGALTISTPGTPGKSSLEGPLLFQQGTLGGEGIRMSRFYKLTGHY